MNISDYFGRIFNRAVNSGYTGNELPDIYPMALDAKLFCKTDMLATYAKILTDTVERTQGIPEDDEHILWDSCEQSHSSEGLVTLLAQAMVDKSDLYLVYNETKVLRRATNEEQSQIQKDYREKAESSIGVYVSFKKYRRTDMLEIYAALEYSVLASLHRTVNVSKAVQVKISDLRKSVSLADAGIALAQAQAIADALSRGKDVAMDKNDEITTATPNIEPTEKAIAFLDSKRAFILGLPLAYISGLQTGGIGTTGEADMRAVERGLKQYFLTIIQPVLKALLKIEDLSFRSQDFRQVQAGLEALKAFELATDDYLSKQAKIDILRRMFELDPDEEQKNLEDEQAERDDEPQQVAAPIVRQINAAPEVR